MPKESRQLLPGEQNVPIDATVVGSEHPVREVKAETSCKASVDSHNCGHVLKISRLHSHTLSQISRNSEYVGLFIFDIKKKTHHYATISRYVRKSTKFMFDITNKPTLNHDVMLVYVFCGSFIFDIKNKLESLPHLWAYSIKYEQVFFDIKNKLTPKSNKNMLFSPTDRSAFVELSAPSSGRRRAATAPSSHRW